jgi:branched-subunit amino acid transport protein
MAAIDRWPYMLGAIAGLVVGTVITRSSFFVLPARIELPLWLERALRYAPACALAAIIAPGVLAHDGHVTISWGNEQLWTLAVATFVFARTRNMLAMMVVGMSVFTALRLLG